MTAKFKKYTSVQYTNEAKDILRRICKGAVHADTKGIVVETPRWDERPKNLGFPLVSTYLYTVEFENGEVREIAESLLEEFQ